MTELYWLEGYQLEILQSINKKLFGDGSSLDPDVRRDMANQMFVILNEVENQSDHDYQA